MTYLETIPNGFNLPAGTYQGTWHRFHVKIIVDDVSYTLRISKYQGVPDVPVTAKIEYGLIDIYLGEQENET